MRERIAYDLGAAGDVRALSILFGLPQYVLRRWQLEGFISRSILSAVDWAILNMIRSCIWDNRNVLRAMLRGMPMSERRRLVDTCEKTTIERIVYDDFLRFKISGTGIMGDGRSVTFKRYAEYLSWRHPNLNYLLTYQIFIRQRKAALAKINYARKIGTLDQLIQDMTNRISQAS